MPNEGTEVEHDLRSIFQEQRQLQEHLVAIQLQISQQEAWLTLQMPPHEADQERREELLALQAYEAPLWSHVAFLDEVILELACEQPSWPHPKVLLAA
jgi:hypothetical protein